MVAGDYDGDFATNFLPFELLNQFLQKSPVDLLKHFGKLDANGRLTIAENGQGRLKELVHPKRRLEEY